MASLYKQPIVIRDPKTGEKVKTKFRKWWGRYRDAYGTEERVPLTKDAPISHVVCHERLGGLLKHYERRAA